MNNRWYCYQLISNSILIIYIIHITLSICTTVIPCAIDGRIACGMVSVFDFTTDRKKRKENVAHEKKVKNIERYVYCGRSTVDCVIVHCSFYADTDNSQCRR